MSENFFVPADTREARLSTWFNQQDDFFAFRTWPSWVRHLAVRAHKRNLERFQLFQFFTGNGLLPEKAAEWVTSADAAGKPLELVPGDYDNDAWRHMAWLVNASLSGTFWKGSALVFDMMKGIVVKM